MSETQAKSNGWVLILGATSGIGKAVARQWAAGGQDLILAARDVAEMERNAADLRLRFGARVETISFDAIAIDQHDSFWRECLSRAGGDLRGVVLCYGYMAPQADVQIDWSKAHQMMATNYTSAVLLLERAAAEFEAKRSGYLCVFTSVAGERGRQSNYLYGSSKAALSTYLQGLRNRLFRSNVAVIDIKPGFVDTAMTWGLPGLFLVARPEDVAADAWAAVRAGRSTVYTPWFWRHILQIIRSIPEPVFKRMKL